MSVVFTSPEDVINDCLVRIGLKTRIGNIYEGSEASKVALDVYGQTRDDLLRAGQWGFARRDTTLTLLKSAPAGGYIVTAWTNAYPPVPWPYEYTYPSDCLKVRSLRLTPAFLTDFDPQPTVFDTPNDSGYTPPRKVIVANIGPVVLCTYTGQIVDPATWEANFTEALCVELAKRMALALSNVDAEKIAAADEPSAVAIAAMTQG